LLFRLVHLEGARPEGPGVALTVMSTALRNFVRQSRFLMWVYVPALAVAGWESLSGMHESRRASDRSAALVNYGFTASQQQLLEGLYPERPRTAMYLGSEALLVKGDLPEARRLFEAALATGIKTEEQLFYHYACTLILLKEDPKTIDAAIARWRMNFPKTSF